MRLDLSAEAFTYAAAVRQPHLDALRGLGVTPAALAAVNAEQPAIGVVNAERGRDGLWQPGAGPAHLVQPVAVGNEIIDLVAWRSLRHDDWSLRTGAAWALGEDWLPEVAWPGADPLLVHPTPLAWLAAAGRGLCVLDWKSASIRRLLDVDAIEVADRAFGDLLLREISRPARLPRISLTRQRDVG